MLELDPDHVPWVNLFPNYASTAQLGTSSYDQYVSDFMTIVQPKVLCYDNYLFSNDNHFSNMETIRLILDELGKPESLIRHVEDRPGHDLRYPMEGGKLRALGWEPAMVWEDGIRRTVRWFAEHAEWMERSVARGKKYFEELIDSKPNPGE